MARCGRLSCFQVCVEQVPPEEAPAEGAHAERVRVETAAVPVDRGDGRGSCGAHLADVVHELALWARDQPRRPARVVVYAMTDHPCSNGARIFDRLALGTIPV
jgi:hypothetical protein